MEFERIPMQEFGYQKNDTSRRKAGGIAGGLSQDLVDTRMGHRCHLWRANERIYQAERNKI